MSIGAEPLFGSWTVTIAVVLAVAATLWRYQPRLGSRSQQFWLTGCRVVAALTLLLILVRPALTRSDNRPTTATLLVGVDTSASMSVEVADPRPGGGASTRYELQNQLLAGLLDRLRSSAQSDRGVSVQLIAYDEAARALTTSGQAGWVDPTLPPQPAGQATDLASVLTAAGSAVSAGPVLGLVLIGDGRQNLTLGTAAASRGDTPAATATAATATSAAEALTAGGVPLWSVPIGGGDLRRRDVEVTGLPPTMQLYAGTDTDSSVQLAAAGAQGEPLMLRWSWTDSAGRSQVAATRTVTPTATDWQTAVSVTLRSPPPGEYRLEVAASPIAGEAVVSNNRLGSFVEVREGGGRVLLIQGTVGLETAYLRRAIAGFADLQLSTRLIPADTSPRWPIDLSAELDGDRFDAVMIFGLPAAAIGEDQWKQIADSVAGGGGLLMLGGPGAYGTDYQSSPIADALPVRPAGDRPDGQDQANRSVRLLVAGRHPITQMGETTPIEQLPAQLGFHPWAGVRVAPGVQTILQVASTDGTANAQPPPAMVVGEFGSGRVAAMAFDSTWRWVRAGEAESHRRFWRQTLLWLLARATDEDDVRLELPVRRIGRGQRCDFRAIFAGSSVAPTAADAGVRIVDTKTSQPVDVAMRLDRGTSTIDGVAGPLPPGIYRVEILAPGAGDGTSPVSARAFEVVDDSVELTRSQADPATLRRLADITGPVGGASFDPANLQPLVDEIVRRHRSAAEVIVERKRLGDGPTTAWPLLVVFAGALSAEWWLRRRWGIEI